MGDQIDWACLDPLYLHCRAEGFGLAVEYCDGWAISLYDPDSGDAFLSTTRPNLEATAAEALRLSRAALAR